MFVCVCVYIHISTHHIVCRTILSIAIWRRFDYSVMRASELDQRE